MAITDYIPNVFGSATPTTYEGLLGMGLITPEQMAQTQKTANIQGLLGAGLALAQGMSKIGPRRSAAENILGALAGGFGAAGGAYQQGLQNFATQQQLTQAQLAQQDAMIKRQQTMAQQSAIENLIKDPRISSDPLKVAYIRSNPNEALKLYSELLPLMSVGQDSSQVKAPTQIPAQMQPQTQAPVQGVQEPSLPPVQVTEKPSQYSQRLAEKQQLENTIRIYGDPTKFAGNERAGKIVDQALKRLEAINKEITKVSVSDLSGDLQTFRNSAPEQFRPAIDNLMNIAATGEISPDQYSQRVQALQKDINDYRQKELEYTRAQNNYQNEAYRIGQEVAPGVDPKNYTPAQIAEIQKRLVKQEKELRIAGRNITTVNVGEKKFAEEFGKGVASSVETTYNRAVAAQNSLSTINNIKPLIKEGVYSGPLSTSRMYVDRLASSLGITSGSIDEKLARTSQAMQGLASLELSAAEAMRGQGAITENERALIARAAAGNFAQFTAGEVSSLLTALEKTANSKIATHTKNLDRLRKRKDTAELADFYELGGGNTLQDAARQELERRKRGQ